MSASFKAFRERASEAIGDERLQGALDLGTANFLRMRNEAFAELPDFEAMRDHFKEARQATLCQLVHHLEDFEKNATAAGARVHWARDGREACARVIEIAREHRVTLATKSKSMATEEIGLNSALENAGIEAVETDLGEWILQLAGEQPSHIIAPAIHKTREQAADLVSRAGGRSIPEDDIPAITAEARRVLRGRFLEAGMGISGGNIAVAETGSVVLVTNEGNGRLVTSAPPVHVAVVGIEKVAPTWDEAALWLSLLGRSAAGQPLSIYTSVVTGPACEGDPDGPREVHIILLDNGRSARVGTAYEEVLQCIRCGACLNVCPVYREAGGHAYGSPYCGPIGAVVNPLLLGLEENDALPHASSLCGACRDVCPVRIDLPRMLLELRNDEVDGEVLPWHERKLEEAAGFIMRHERLMRWTADFLRLVQRPFVREDVLRLPAFLDPACGRDLPALSKRSFRDLWRSGDLEGLE